MTERWPLRRRLVAVVIGLLAVMASAMGLASTLALRGSLIDQIDSRLLAASARAANPLLVPGGGSNPGPTTTATPPGDIRPPGLRQPGQQDVGAVNLFVRNGEVFAGYFDESGEFRTLAPAQVATLENLADDGRVHPVELAALGPYRAVSTTTAIGSRVITALSTRATDATVGRYLVVEALVAAIGLSLAALAGTALVRRELRGLTRVAATATRVSGLPLDRGEVELAERVEVADRDRGTEIGQVSAALNRLLGHVEAALTARHASETQVRQFVADASHELRTPLASIRGYAELVRRLPADLPPDVLQAMGRVEQESIRMTRLVEEMLLLARLDAEREFERAPVDLATLAVDAVADAHAAGPDHTWHLDLGTETADDAVRAPGFVVLGDDHQLRQVLANLLSNARVHTPPATTVTVRLREHDGNIEIRVADDGPRIPEELRPHLFDRFSRGDTARTASFGSTGLGLSIVAAVVAAHGGTVGLDATAGATSFVVNLPAA